MTNKAKTQESERNPVPREKSPGPFKQLLNWLIKGTRKASVQKEGCSA